MLSYLKVEWLETMKKFNIRNFYSEVKEELSKVNWPARSATISTSLVVLVVVGMIAVYLGVVDLVVSRLASVIMG